MGARHKLNVAYFNGALIIAALIGVYFQSWLVFVAALAILFAASLYDGSIRPER